NRVAPPGQVLAKDGMESVVGQLGLLEAEDIGLALIQPRDEAGHALPQGVHVPGRDAHRSTLALISRRARHQRGCFSHLDAAATQLEIESYGTQDVVAKSRVASEGPERCGRRVLSRSAPGS